MTAHKPRKWTDAEEKEHVRDVVKLRNEGKTCSEVAALLRLPLSRIANLTRKYKWADKWPRVQKMRYRPIPNSIKKVGSVEDLGPFSIVVKYQFGEPAIINVLPTALCQLRDIVNLLRACGGEVL